MSKLVQRYLNGQKDHTGGRAVTVGDLEGIGQQLKELKQINRLLLESAYTEETLLSKESLLSQESLPSRESLLSNTSSNTTSTLDS